MKKSVFGAIFDVKLLSHNQKTSFHHITVITELFLLCFCSQIFAFQTVSENSSLLL